CVQPTTRIPTGSSPARPIWCGKISKACRRRPGIRSWPAARWVSTVLARHPTSLIPPTETTSPPLGRGVAAGDAEGEGLAADRVLSERLACPIPPPAHLV